MNSCEKNQELISRLVDNDLSAAEKAELEAHIKTCDECKSLYMAFSSVSSAISDSLEEPPASLKANVMAAVKGKSGKVTHINRWKSWFAIAACLAVIIFGVSRTDLMDKLGTNAKSGLPPVTAVTAETSDGVSAGCDEASVKNDKGRSADIMTVVTPDGCLEVSDNDMQARITRLLSPGEAAAASLEDTQAQKSAADISRDEYTVTYPDGKIISVRIGDGQVLCLNMTDGNRYSPSCTAQEFLKAISEMK